MHHEPSLEPGRRSAAAPKESPLPASPVMRVVCRFAVPLTALVSVVIFMQGHNLPGGGFIAGVLAAAAGVIYLLAFGVERAARVSWWRIGVVGMLIACGTGAAPMLAGYSYMDHTVWHLHLPVIGEYELPTATFFDLGVYLIVVGTLMTIFVELGIEDR